MKKLTSQQILDAVMAYATREGHPVVPTSEKELGPLLPEIFAAYPSELHPTQIHKVAQRIQLDLYGKRLLRKVAPAQYRLVDVSPKALSLLGQTSKEKLAYFKSLLSPCELDQLTEFMSLHLDSMESNDSKFLDGTADGLCPKGTPARFAENSHIVDKFLSAVTGLPQFNRSANVLKELGDVNRGRYGDYITTKVNGLENGLPCSPRCAPPFAHLYAPREAIAGSFEHGIRLSESFSNSRDYHESPNTGT